MYRRVRGTWPYRAELDRIVRTLEGAIAACCPGWTRPTARACSSRSRPIRRTRTGASPGLSWEMRCALRDAGATEALVGTSGPAARAAYTAAGFRPWKREVTMRKPLGGPPMATCESG